MRLANALLLISSVAFALTGVGYLLLPATMLGVVGIPPTSTSDFLLRTEAVALVTAAGLAWAARDGPPVRVSIALAALSLYYVVGSAVDLAAFTDGIVGPASVPSAAVRLVLGGLCAFVAGRTFARA